MNKAEALQVAADRLAVLRTWSYDDLVATLIDEETVEEVTASSGAVYVLESQAHWDGKAGGDLRVSIGVDDGGWRAFMPLCVDFIMAPDGTFVDD